MMFRFLTPKFLMKTISVNNGFTLMAYQRNLDNYYVSFKPVLQKRSVIFLIFVTVIGCTLLFIMCNNVCKEEDSGSKRSSLISGETVKDIDGNVYSTITIGFQEWMVENLKTTKFNDGIPIPYLGKNKEAKKTYCWYNNDVKNKSSYGGLYSWFAVNSGKLAPKGWHIPDTTEWKAMIKYLGNNAINKLQDTGSGKWVNRNPNATNASGFKALPSGLGRVIYLDKPSYDFTGKGQWGGWWSSRDPNNKSPNQHFALYMANNSNLWQIFQQYEPEEYCLSVRCLKNSRPILKTEGVSGISNSSVTALGNVVTNGGSLITSRGFCWFKAQDPKNKHSITTKEKGTGSYNIKITELQSGTIYYVKAFAKNKLGTSFGDEVKFITKR